MPSLSKQDVELLKAFIAREARDPYREPHEGVSFDQSAPEVYVAVPPCGVGIPARSGDVAGTANCCIFKLVLQEGSPDGLTGFNYQIAPIYQQGSGEPVQRTVYNVFNADIPPLMPPNEQYLRIKKDKFGRWLAEPFGQFNTSTTTTPGQIVPGIPIQCQGQCEWTWNGTYWTTTGCTTTTTTSTTASSSTTTTTVACLCPSNTTTSTTTTPCGYCSYPSICGTSVGQCYFTSCAATAQTQVGNCTQITTTSTTTTTPVGCNCNTTSTSGFCTNCGGPSNNCGANCTWVWNSNNSTWQNTHAGCAVCPPPPSNPTPQQQCGAWVSYCGAGVFGGPNAGGQENGPSGCIGPKLCCWCWNGNAQQWVLSNNVGSDFTGNSFVPCCVDPFYDLGPRTCWNNASNDCVQGIVKVPAPFGPNGGALYQDYCIGGITCPYPSGPPANPAVNTGACAPCQLTQQQEYDYCLINTAPGTWTVPIINYGPNWPKDCNCNWQNPTTTTQAGTNTTQPPACSCGGCYTTTSSSSTTTTPGACLFQCSGTGGTWNIVTNNCGSGFICNPPATGCQSSCQIEVISCITTTSTSTTTTT